jgi:hypothetical protein
MTYTPDKASSGLHSEARLHLHGALRQVREVLLDEGKEDSPRTLLQEEQTA